MHEDHLDEQNNALTSANQRHRRNAKVPFFSLNNSPFSQIWRIEKREKCWNSREKKTQS